MERIVSAYIIALVSFKNDLVAGERCDVTGEYFERPGLHV